MVITLNLVALQDHREDWLHRLGEDVVTPEFREGPKASLHLTLVLVMS